MKKIVWMVVILLVLALAVWRFTVEIKNVDAPISTTSYKDATYILDGKAVTLKNGYAETPAAPGSASKVVTQYFGNEVRHDLNNDGLPDVVFLLTQNTGGTGTYYYVVAALQTPTGYVGSEGYLLGDRIAPQTTNIDEGQAAEGRQRQNVIVVNYADRNPGEPFSVRPSLGKSVWLKLDPATMQFGVVDPQFAGETN